jgi:hypothetical protein
VEPPISLLDLLPQLQGNWHYGLSDSGGTIENPRPGNCQSRTPRTTKLYNRTNDTISLDEVEFEVCSGH